MESGAANAQNRARTATAATLGREEIKAVVVDAAGTPSIINGTPVLTASITAGTDKALFPEIPSTKCIIGGVKVVTDSTHTFIPGTTELSAAGITDTYFNLSCVPVAGYA